MGTLIASESRKVRYSTRYLVLGAIAGVLAPAGLFAYGLVRGRELDAFEVFAIMAAGGVVTLGAAGWMIGRRDDVLRARNRELRALSESLQQLSTLDALTRIPNRRALDDRLAQEVARFNRYGTPLALVMIDLDRFKDLNDRHGHAAGDRVLQQVAAALDREKRLGDLVARFGGEEFVAILPHTDAEAAQAWAERVRGAIGATIEAAVPVTASFGVAQASPDGETPTRLLEAADQALYTAKRQGRNRVVSAPSLGRERAAR